jgi:hypothetical protein
MTSYGLYGVVACLSGGIYGLGNNEVYDTIVLGQCLVKHGQHQYDRFISHQHMHYRSLDLLHIKNPRICFMNEYLREISAT